MSLNTVSADNKTPSSLQILKAAVFNTNKHFMGLIQDMSFTLLLCISIFTPMWVWYINIFGAEHFIVMLFQTTMHLSFIVVILFMLSLFLFNRICSSRPVLTFWAFTKEVSWPWLVEGIKASAIIFAALLCFIIPGIIKHIHYTFFSFIVFFNKNYKENKINTLKHSKKLSQGLGWWIFGLVVILPLLIYSLPKLISKTVFEQTDSLWIIYPSLILCLYITCLLLTYIYSILFFIYVIKDQNQMVGPVKIEQYQKNEK